MKLRVGRQAQAQADKIDDWWVENRPSAPALFADELEATLRLIRSSPGAGVGWPTPRRPTLRRILMPRTQHHVYFRVDQAKKTVFVLAVWGAPRGRGPKL